MWEDSYCNTVFTLTIRDSNKIPCRNKIICDTYRKSEFIIIRINMITCVCALVCYSMHVLYLKNKSSYDTETSYDGRLAVGSIVPYL